MNYTTGRKPIVLLLDETTNNSEFIKVWLKNNDFLACEAADIFQALEEFSDFTVRQCPDVVMLEAGALSPEYIKEVFRSCCGEENVSVVSLKKSTKNNGTADTLALLQQRLDQALPRMSRAA